MFHTQAPSTHANLKFLHPEEQIQKHSRLYQTFSTGRHSTLDTVRLLLRLRDGAGAVVPVHCRKVVRLVLGDIKGHQLHHLSSYTNLR